MITSPDLETTHYQLYQRGDHVAIVPRGLASVTVLDDPRALRALADELETLRDWLDSYADQREAEELTAVG